MEIEFYFRFKLKPKTKKVKEVAMEIEFYFRFKLKPKTKKSYPRRRRRGVTTRTQVGF